MKLAEALQLRADLQKRMAQLAGRLYDNATVQANSPPRTPKSCWQNTRTASSSWRT